MGYARIGEGARLDRPPPEANHSDDVLIALALYPLLELEQDSTVRGHYERAAERWFHGGTHPGIDVEANPLATFLHRHWTGDGSYDAAALDTLRGVPLDMKWNPDTIAAYSRRFGFSSHAGPGPPPGARRALADCAARQNLELSRPQPVSPGWRPARGRALRDERPRLPAQLLVWPGARRDSADRLRARTPGREQSGAVPAPPKPEMRSRLIAAAVSSSYESSDAA